jgi:hypothetical protein
VSKSIVIVLWHIDDSGQTRIAADAARVLHATGHHVHVIAHWHDSDCRLDIPDDIPLYVLSGQSSEAKIIPKAKQGLFRKLRFLRRASLHIKRIREVYKKHIKDQDIPVVACGVGHIALENSALTENITGISGPSLFHPLINTLRKATSKKDPRIAFLAGSNKGVARMINQLQAECKPTIRLVKTGDQWKGSFNALQKDADALILGPIQGIASFNREAMLEHVRKNTVIPTGTEIRSMSAFSIFCLIPAVSDQGLWTAFTARRMVRIGNARTIPTARSRETRVWTNRKLLEQSGLNLAE